MTREEFKILVKGMKAVYAQVTFIPDQDAFNIWFEMLKDLPYQQVNMAIQKHMMTEKFPPTIADLRTRADEISRKQVEEMSELEAWGHVEKAIRNSIYNAENEFEKLPEACQIAVGTPANLREWAKMDSESVVTVEQSHFIRSYRAAVKRIDENKKLPEQFRCRIETRKKNVIEERTLSSKLILTEKSEISEDTKKKLDEMMKILQQ